MKTAIIIISLLAVVGIVIVLIYKKPTPAPTQNYSSNTGSAPAATIGQSLAANSGLISESLASILDSLSNNNNQTGSTQIEQDAARG